jgi:hypothetical protein
VTVASFMSSMDINSASYGRSSATWCGTPGAAHWVHAHHQLHDQVYHPWQPSARTHFRTPQHRTPATPRVVYTSVVYTSVVYTSVVHTTHTPPYRNEIVYSTPERGGMGETGATCCGWLHIGDGGWVPPHTIVCSILNQPSNMHNETTRSCCSLRFGAPPIDDKGSAGHVSHGRSRIPSQSPARRDQVGNQGG